jgi:hypothetical protein
VGRIWKANTYPIAGSLTLIRLPNKKALPLSVNSSTDVKKPPKILKKDFTHSTLNTPKAKTN